MLDIQLMDWIFRKKEPILVLWLVGKLWSVLVGKFENGVSTYQMGKNES